MPLVLDGWFNEREHTHIYIYIRRVVSRGVVGNKIGIVTDWLASLKPALQRTTPRYILIHFLYTIYQSRVYLHSICRSVHVQRSVRENEEEGTLGYRCQPLTLCLPANHVSFQSRANDETQKHFALLLLRHCVANVRTASLCALLDLKYLQGNRIARRKRRRTYVRASSTRIFYRTSYSTRLL